MAFPFCKLLRNGKKSFVTFDCQKCQSNLARIRFSKSSSFFPEDFAMDDDETLTTLRDWEINFLKEELQMDFLFQVIILLWIF